jgi:phospho-N-acetylmuramoyl-pentapeptide-transferase
MLLSFLDRLLADWPDLGAWRALDRITLRAAMAAGASFVLAIICGNRMIAWLERRFREPIKSASADVARLHDCKRATPTMGGIFIVAGLVASAATFADWSNPYMAVVILLALALAALGACDDLIKLKTPARGMRPRVKLIAQTAIAITIAMLVERIQVQHGHVPRLGLLGAGHVELGTMFVPWAALVIVASSNAVNLADGLDGLAGGCLIAATLALGLVSYACGHAQWAGYLGIEHLAGAGEMAVVCGAMVGGLLGFLWFNCHPAQVFMGNTGSLSLGGLLGLLAVIARQELLLLVIGGVFVTEALSVIVQVGWFRWRKKRMFLCAPLHHHFQLQGWSEDKIVVRFWIAAALCAILALAGLKLQAREASGNDTWAEIERTYR